MPSMKTIKRRMTSVGTTKKIIRAMGMVAASKLQKDRARLLNARLFLEEAKKIAGDLQSCEEAMKNAFFKARSVKNTAYVVITSDRGLCGSYNANLMEKTLAHMDGCKKENVIAIGYKGYDYLKRHGKNILHRYVDVLETAFYEDAERIAGYLLSLYVSDEIDEVYVAYTRFESALTHIPSIDRILPLSPKPSIQVGGMKYEQDIHSFIDHAVSLYLSAFLYTALNESIACEQAARMVSADSATKNAANIINKLTRVYNRRRQASITQEISEVVNSANMLK